MSSSSSNPSNTTSTTTNASETNLSAANTQGVTLVGNKGTTNLTSTSVTNNVSTDNGAVLAGTQLGSQAIAANTGLSEALAKEESDALSASSAQSATLVGNVLTQGINFIEGENQAVMQLVQQNTASQNQNLATTAATLGSIAQANDTSQASQSTAFATSALKIAAVLVLGVSVIYFVTRK